MAFDEKHGAPDFFVVGAAKAGTTAVWSWMQQHPEVFLPALKEPSFYAFEGRSAAPRAGPYDKDYVRGISTSRLQYARLFAGAQGKVCGDVSPVYLSDEQAAERIALARPDARVVILLRDPVDRAYSQYLHHRRDGLEPCTSFEAALRVEPARMAEGWSWGHAYLRGGRYASQVARYLSVFPSQQILILDYERLQSAPSACWDEICQHLRIAAHPMPRNERVNQTKHLQGVPRFQGIERALRHPGAVQRSVKSVIPGAFRRGLRQILGRQTTAVHPLDPRTRQSLAKEFAKDRDWLRQNTGLSLQGWST